MVPPFLETPLEPLLSAYYRLGGIHLSLFGSATRKPLGSVGDLDLHLVLPRMDRQAFEALAGAAESAARDLATQAGRPWRVELRHGPFKPALPDAGTPRELQLHLLMDDRSSLERLPCVLIAQRAAMGIPLAGEPLAGARKDCGSRRTWLREARRELERWRDALAAREIPFRHWTFHPVPDLVEGRIAAETVLDFQCLLRGAAHGSDLHYRAAMLMGEGGPADDLARPLLSQIGPEPAGEALAESWERVSRQAMGVLEQRLSRLAGQIPGTDLVISPE